jgi:hypothetical protein
MFRFIYDHSQGRLQHLRMVIYEPKYAVYYFFKLLIF